MRFAWSIPLIAASLLQPASAQVAQQENHTYDELGRLTSTTNTGDELTGETRSICYDEAGNRVDFEVRTDGTTLNCSAPNPQTPPTEPPEPTEEPLPDPPANYAPVANPDVAEGDCETTGPTDVLANDTDAENDDLTLVSIEFDSGDSSADAFITPVIGDVTVLYPVTAGQSAFFIYVVEDEASNQSEGVLRVTSWSPCQQGA